MNEQVDMSLVVGILITMVFSAFFSGMEIAFVSSNRMLAEMDKEKNGLTQRLLSLFYNHPNGFVSTMLVGNNIALVVYGILIARLFDNTRKGNFLLSFLTLTSKKAKNSLFPLSYLMMWSLTSSILRDVDLIILNSKLSNFITSLSLGKL